MFLFILNILFLIKNVECAIALRQKIRKNKKKLIFTKFVIYLIVKFFLLIYDSKRKRKILKYSSLIFYLD